MKKFLPKVFIGGLLTISFVLIVFWGGYLRSFSTELGEELDKISQAALSSKKQEDMLSYISILENLQVLYKNHSELARIHFLKGILHYNLENFEEAISSWYGCFFNRKHHLSPLALLYAGMTLESLGQWQTAVDLFSLHAKRYPKHFTRYETALGLSRCLGFLSKKEDACKVLRASKLEKKSPYNMLFRQQISFLENDL